ncbi:hypothetical protein NLX83_33120 [Allokutzneria sp. A3M-2-11 16]|nr:hypothetical protein [Allokutzneria sp. A3M-2-11 16]MCP3804125.1 hypothetical protein [Allokutzneria sp. A3M-2-11 16]
MAAIAALRRFAECDLVLVQGADLGRIGAELASRYLDGGSSAVVVR